MNTKLETKAQATAGRSIALAALLLMVGNFASRILGLVRDKVINHNFGVGAETSLYSLLSAVPTQLYDFLVGGLVSAALVPVLTDYIDQHDDGDLWQIINTILTMLGLVLGLLGGLVWIFAEPINQVLAAKIVASPTMLSLGVSMLHSMVIAVVFMCLSGVLTGLLQAQRRFSLPAFTSTVFNLALIVLIWFWPQDARVLGWAMVAGALAQVSLQLPALRGARLRPMLRWQHPGVRRIGLLYAPVALGISFSFVGTLIDRQLAGSIDQQSAAYMRSATTFIQFALGLVAAAISIAILPTLSRLNSDGDEAGFRRILGIGLKVVLLLIVPMLVIFGLLGEAVVRILFEGGKFSAENTRITALVLLAYLPSMLAAAIDQPLIFAFYARKHTLLPNLVQAPAIASYFLVAGLSYRHWGMYGLIAGNVAQLSVHALVMAVVAHRRLRVFDGQAMLQASAKIASAALVMAASCWGILQLLPTTPSKFNALVVLLVAGGGSGLIYLGLLWWLKLDALQFFGAALQRKFKRKAA